MTNITADQQASAEAFDFDWLDKMASATGEAAKAKELKAAEKIMADFHSAFKIARAEFVEKLGQEQGKKKDA